MSQFVQNWHFKISVKLGFDTLMPKYGHLGPRPLRLKKDAILLFQKQELLKTLPTSPQPFSLYNSMPRYE